MTSALGGPGRVGADNEPPYPRLRVLDTTGGADRDLRWLAAQEIQVDAYGDLSGFPGKGELRRILYVALGALMELPEQPPASGFPVVTAVTSTRAGGWLPEPTGQPRYVALIRVFSHPTPE